MSYKESYEILEGDSRLSTQILKDGRVQIIWMEGSKLIGYSNLDFNGDKENGVCTS